MKKIKFILYLFLLIIGGFLFFNSEVLAAEGKLILSPSSGSYTIGKTFSIGVRVDSGGGVGINAADGLITFDTSYLSISGLSQSNSIFELWTQQPTFSNSKGEISFGGGAPTAYKGSSGLIFTITFKGKKPGTTEVKFQSGSVLAADGKGTNVLSSLGKGTYTLSEAVPGEEEEEEEPIVPITGNLPPLPEVTSPTHPEEEKWYSNNSPQMEWELPSTVTSVRTLIGQQESSFPTVSYVPPISEKTIENLEDGIWYFHIRFGSQVGFGPVLHRKILIDTQAPEPFDIEVKREDAADPRPFLIFRTNDIPSGVDFYEIKIDDGEIITISAEELEEEPFQMPVQEPGDHSVLVKAIDRAGNSTEASKTINIEALRPPVITEYPETMNKGEIIIIKGISFYPNSTIKIYFGKGEETSEAEVKTDETGLWVYEGGQNLEKGTYEVWARVFDKRGGKSHPSEKINIKVVAPFLLFIYSVPIMIGLFTLLVLFIIFFFLYKRKKEEKEEKLKKEVREVKDAADRVFKALRMEIEEQIEQMNKKPGLTASEAKLRDKLKEALIISEEFLSKEIKDVEEELGEIEKPEKKDNNKK